MYEKLIEIEEMLTLSSDERKNKTLLHIICLTLEPYKHDANIGSMCVTALALTKMYFSDKDIGSDPTLIKNDLLLTIDNLKSAIKHQHLI